MTTFAILTGKSLSKAIAGFGKVVSTFSEKTHQLAYSAINHVEEHHDAIYCTALYNATPANYRAPLAKWLTAFGKVAFDSKKLTFSYSKGKKSDLPTALTVSPADYAKSGKAETGKASKTLFERIEAIISKAMEAGGMSDADEKFADFMEIQLGKYKAIAARDAKAAAGNVVEMKQPEKQADQPKEQAPKAAAPKVAAKSVKAAPKVAKAPKENGFTVEPREDQPVHVNGSIHREPVAA